MTRVLTQDQLLAPEFDSNALGWNQTVMVVLKEELFTAEKEHLQGKLSDAQYAELRSALEIVLRRALARIEG